MSYFRETRKPRVQKLANKGVGEPLKGGGVRPLTSPYLRSLYLRSLYLRVVKLVRPEDELPAPVRPTAPVLPPFFFLVRERVPIAPWIVGLALWVPRLMRS